MKNKSSPSVLLPKKVLIDTSFLISLVKEHDVLHKNAKDYFEALLENGSILFLSAIVWAEFSQQQKVFEILQNFRFLPFGYKEAQKIHDITDEKFIKSFQNGWRTSAKDGVKILSHYFSEGMDAVITTDKDFILLANGHLAKTIDFKEPLASYLGQLGL